MRESPVRCLFVESGHPLGYIIRVQPATALLAAGLAALFASCQRTNLADLKTVATEYFLPEHPEKPHDYRSDLSRQERPGTETAKPGWVARKVTVIGEREVNGEKFGLVGVDYLVKGQNGECSHLDTSTWTREHGSWRRIRLEKTAARGGQALQKGDFQGVSEAANDWLRADPLSVYALNLRLMTEERIGAAADAAETIKTLQSISPDDSTVQFAAASDTHDLDQAKAALNRMKEDDCLRPDAAIGLVRNLGKAGRMEEAMQILDGETVYRRLLLTRIAVLLELKQINKLKENLSVENDAAMKSQMEAHDPAYAGGDVTIGQAYLAVGDLADAKRWRDYAMERDPNDTRIMALAVGIARAEPRR